MVMSRGPSCILVLWTHIFGWIFKSHLEEIIGLEDFGWYSEWKYGQYLGILLHIFGNLLNTIIQLPNLLAVYGRKEYSWKLLGIQGTHSLSYYGVILMSVGKFYSNLHGMQFTTKNHHDKHIQAVYELCDIP